MKQVMTNALENPAVQVALGVTETQRTLQGIRANREAFRIALAMVRASVAEDGGGPTLNLSTSFNVTAGPTLFPFLADNQIAKLRRFALRDRPLESLNTDEVAFSLELTAAQRARIADLFNAQAKATMDPKRPSVQALQKAFAKIAADAAKFPAADDEDTTFTVERIDRFTPFIMRMFEAASEATRLAAKEKFPSVGDPMKLLTPLQLRRYRALAGER
jgi:hypothetical protein